MKNLEQYITKFNPEVWNYMDYDFEESFCNTVFDYLGSFETFKDEDIKLLKKYGYDYTDFLEE